MSAPWLKFYPTDWRSDPRLRMCSMAARGLWIEMIALMHEATPYGHLLVSGHSPTDAQLAVLAGAPSEQVSELLGELESAGVFSRTREGTIYSRKLTRMQKKAAQARNNGRRGGNPTLRKDEESSALDNRMLNADDKPQKPEARSQKPEGEEGSDKSDPPPPSGGGDFDGFVSELAKAVGYDKPPAMWRSKKAKTHIRGWLESHDEDALVDIARRSRETHPEPPETPQALDSFIERDAQKPAPVPPPSLEEKCAYWAEKVNGPGYVSPNAIKPELARDLLRAGLVTPEKLKERGIAA